MKFNLPKSEVFVPDGLAEHQALSRTTHLAIGAHQDDLEIMALDGILQCFQNSSQWYCGVIVTNGSGSPRAGLYSAYTDEEMQVVRRKEQIKAAVVGEYGAQIFLDYPSSAIKDSLNQQVADDLVTVLQVTKPRVVYTHNLADKHDTHIGVAVKTLAAIRQLPDVNKPNKVYSCEVWRDLDWMVDADKISFNHSQQENLQNALLGVFDSQITGGKRYDLATMGRRRAHATYFSTHETDEVTGLSFAMDLTPLVYDSNINIDSYVKEYLNRFSDDVLSRLRRIAGS